MGMLSTWPANWIVNVETIGGAMEPVLISRWGGHGWIPDHPEQPCPQCGEMGEHSVENPAPPLDIPGIVQ